MELTLERPNLSERAPASMPAVRTGAQALLETLVECGVDTIFGYPGGAALPLYDALYSEPRLRHILVRHEQAAVHAAEGYARTTGRVGVVLVTSGPGVGNTITGQNGNPCHLREITIMRDKRRCAQFQGGCQLKGVGQFQIGRASCRERVLWYV